MTARPVVLSLGFDPVDPAFRAAPHAFLRKLREQAPVAWLPDRAIWIVSGYDEVRSLFADDRVGSHWAPRSPFVNDRGQREFVRVREEAERLLSTSMHRRSPADHRRLRRLAQTAFSSTRVAARRARIQQLTDERIDEALAQGRMDVVNDLARPVASTIAAEFLGIPEAMRPILGDLARDLMYSLEVPTPPPVVRERGLLAMMALAPRLRQLLSDWRASPPTEDNLVWAMEQARARGEMSEEELVGHVALLLLAGHITTQHLIGNGVLSLLQHPDQWKLLRTRPALIETAVDEFMRFDPPLSVAQRVAFEDLAIGENEIRKGERLLLLVGAAHRDPTVFPDPDRLDISRSPNPHLGFGYGAHYCIGAALARLEAQVAIGTLVRRVPEARLESEALEWENWFSLRALTSLPILVG